MSELIPIREAARRLGVSDTAVRKAIAAGRVKIAGTNEANGRPLLAWPETRQQWETNSDSSKRSHVGGTGTSRERQKYAKEPPEVRLPRSGDGGGGSIEQDAPATGGKKVNYADSRAVRELYQAKLTKLEHDEKIGKLVNADEVKAEWFKHIAAAKTKIMGIPASCKSRYGELPLSVIAIIEQICRETLEDLANGSE